MVLESVDRGYCKKKKKKKKRNRVLEFLAKIFG